MSAAERLHSRLLAALLLSPTAGACTPASNQTPVPDKQIGATKADEKTDEKADEKADKKADRKTDAKADKKTETPQPVPKTTQDVPEPPPPLQPTIAPEPINIPTCPSGMWCGVVGRPATGRDAIEGCPPHPGVTVKPIDPKVPDGPGGTQTTFDVEATKAKRVALGNPNACCYRWVDPCPGGRPLVDGGDVVHTTFVAASSDHDTPAHEHHAEAAAAWLRDAGSEYASVASFARAAIELMAVGAPSDLVHACHRAAIDELRHAELCTRIAWSLGAPQQVPRVVPAVGPREASLVRVAIDTFVEGCVGETLAALVAQTAAAECPDAEIRVALATIAADEEQHAALAWRTIRWALDTGGLAVADALRDAAARIRLVAVPSPAVVDAGLARFGRLDARAQHEALQRGWREVIDPLLRTLLEADRSAEASPRAVAAAC